MHAPKGSGSMAGADRTALLLMGMLAVQASLSFFQALSFATAGQRSLVDLRRDTYARLISLPMTFFAQRRVGELASRLSSDLIQIEDTLITILPQFLRQTTILGRSRSSPTTGGTMPLE
jgi:ATP-binding cassette subfamily B protein